jgi:hypothetical protein
MNKSWFYLVGTIGSLAILTTSCGDGGKPAATPPASPAAVASPASTPAAAVLPTTPTTPTATKAPTVAAVPPTVPGKPAVVIASAGLIPPTNGDNWAKTVTKGRTDPFATLVLQPVLPAKDPLDTTGKPQSTSTIATNNSPAIKSGVNRSLPTIKTTSNNSRSSGKTKIATRTGITRDRNSSISTIPRSGINKVLPKITSKPSKVTKVATNNVLRPVNVSPTTPKTQVAAIPPKAVAQPLQAMAVEISGVIEVEGKTQVIVKLPNESFSRYIEVGDRVANGSVLIKRVESQQSLSPTIVLEEVGVEVARKIGDNSTAGTPNSNTPASTPQR